MGHDQRKGIANARLSMQHTGESAWRFKGGGHAVAGALGCTRRLKKGQKRQARGHAEQASGAVFPSFFPDWAFQVKWSRAGSCWPSSRMNSQEMALAEGITEGTCHHDPLAP